MTQAFKGHLAMLLFSAAIAGSFSLGSMAAVHIEPTVLNAVRFVIASVILGVAALLLTGIPKAAFAAPWRYLLLGGAMGIYFVLMFEGLKTAPPVSAAAVFTLTPIISGVFGYVLLRQVTTARMALALSVGAVGALWVIFRADWQALLAFEVGRGEIIYFWGCVAHALYTPMVRLLNRGERPLVFSFWRDGGGGCAYHAGRLEGHFDHRLGGTAGDRLDNNRLYGANGHRVDPSFFCNSPACICQAPRSWRIPI